MKGAVKKIPANQDEITLYCFAGEALWKIQIVEQALSHSITLKMNPGATKERADEFLKQHQRYTLGTAIKVAIKEKLYASSLQDELSVFLGQRNWLVHNAMSKFLIRHSSRRIFQFRAFPNTQRWRLPTRLTQNLNY